jgi:DNA-binding CsgD family transcriptional regulator
MATRKGPTRAPDANKDGRGRRRPAGGGPAGAHGRREGAGAAVRVARLLALACFLATVPAYSPNIVTLNVGSVAAITPWFARAFHAVALACSLGVVTISFASPKAAARLEAFAPTGASAQVAAPVAAATTYAAGCAGYAAAVMAGGSWPAALEPLGVAFAVLAGVGLIPTCLVWSACYEGLGLRAILLETASAAGIAAVAGAACSAAGPALTHPACLAMLLVGAAAPVALATRAARGSSTPRAGTGTATPAAEQVARPDMRAYLSVMGATLAGMALSSFAIGLAPIYLFLQSVDAQRVGCAIAAAVLVAVALLRVNGPTHTLVRVAVVPGACAVALAACTLSILAGGSLDVALGASASLFSLVAIVAIATACAVSGAREFPRAFVFSTLVGTYCLFALAGILTGDSLGSTTVGHEGLDVALTAVYGCVLLLLSCVRAWRGSVGAGDADGDAPARSRAAGRAEEEADELVYTAAGARAKGRPGEGPGSASLDDKVAALALQGGLTPRETEVLGIVARGHGRTYVAETLLISKNTVYTHMRNIYRKLGVGSREELIQLVNDDVDR